MTALDIVVAICTGMNIVSAAHYNWRDPLYNIGVGAGIIYFLVP